jgi:hypothetical protein
LAVARRRFQLESESQFHGRFPQSDCSCKSFLACTKPADLTKPDNDVVGAGCFSIRNLIDQRVDIALIPDVLLDRTSTGRITPASPGALVSTFEFPQ